MYSKYRYEFALELLRKVCLFEIENMFIFIYRKTQLMNFNKYHVVLH